MSYRLLIKPEAELDLEDTYNWYEQKNRGLGSEFVRVVDASLANIQRNPLAYPLIYKKVRRKLIRRFPYAIFYLINLDTIVIIGCFHAQRDPKHWHKRV